MFHRAVTWVRLGAAVVAVALLALVACGTQPGRTSFDGRGDVQTDDNDAALTPQRGGHLVYGIETDPNGLEPTRNALDPVGVQLANALYDPVAAFDSSGTPRPYLARSIEPVPGSNFTAWRIGTRPGVRFQSGRPLDADAAKLFVDAIRGVYIDPATGGKRGSITQDAASYIIGTEVIGTDDLLIRMSRPWATFPALLAGQGGYIVSQTQLDNPRGHSEPDGSGPYKLRSWEPGKRFSLVRNPDYWRPGLPYLDSVDFVVEPDGNQRIAGLQQGTIDVVAFGNVDDVQRLDGIVSAQGDGRDPGRIRVERDPGTSETVSIMFNTAKRPLDSEIVRQALAYATDVDALARDSGWSRDRIITGPFAPDSPWYVATDMPRFDLPKARQLVNEYKAREGVDDVTFELLSAFDQTMLQRLQEQWARAGIHAVISETEFIKSVPQAVGGLYDAIQFRYFSAVDPDSLYHFWTLETKRPVGEISLNFSRFGNDTIDQALARGRSTTETNVRREAYTTVQREFARWVPYLWLYRTEWVVARTARVHQARNVTLPDGRAALRFDTGTHRLTETWVSSSAG